MDPEQRIAAVIKYTVIERLVFLFRALGGLLCPQRALVVYRKVLDGFFLILFALFLSFLLTLSLSLLMELVGLCVNEINISRSEVAVLAQRHADRCRIKDLNGLFG